MRKLAAALIVFGVIGLNLNMLGVLLHSELTGPSCFLCIVEPASSLDGLIVNQFFVPGFGTLAFVAAVLIGYRMRKKYA